MRKIIVVGAVRSMVVQVLLGSHAFTDCACLVICSSGTRYLRSSTLTSDYLETGFDGTDDAVLIERINQFAGEAADTILIPADCTGVRCVDRIRDRLNVTVIPSPTPAQLDVFDDKWRFHEFCSAAGLQTPHSRLLEDKHALDYPALAAELGLPFIVKPVNEDTSRGAYIISSMEQYRRDILDNMSYQYSPLIVQRYIEGTDVGMNMLSVRGKVRAISIQQRINPARDGSRIKFFANQYLERVAHVIAEESGYEGVMNVDARIEDGTGKVYLFESNPRFWRSHSASVWCGMNFVELSMVKEHGTDVHKLTSGTADTYFHPLFRPALLGHALFGSGQRRRFARAMLLDTCTLFISARIVLVESIKSVRRSFRNLLRNSLSSGRSRPKADPASSA